MQWAYMGADTLYNRTLTGGGKTFHRAKLGVATDVLLS